MADVSLVKRFVLGPVLVLTCVAASPAPRQPDCSGPDRWPANMAFVKLKNAGLITNSKVDFNHVKSRTIVSQRIGQDLWRQVFRVTFLLKSGRKLEAIVVSDASSDECSMSDPQVFLISKAL